MRDYLKRAYRAVSAANRAQLELELREMIDGVIAAKLVWEIDWLGRSLPPAAVASQVAFGDVDASAASAAAPHGDSRSTASEPTSTFMEDEHLINCVTLLVRHGARYPNRDQLTPFAEGSAVRLQWEQGISSGCSDDGDNLTPVGRAQMCALGARLVETGSTLLEVADDSERPSFLLLSSTSPRCEESGDAIARALCSGVNAASACLTNLAEKGTGALFESNSYNGGRLYESKQRDAIFRAWNVNDEYRAAVTRLRNGPLVSAFAGEPSRRSQLEALFNAVDRAGGVKAAVPTPTPAAMLFQCTHVVNMLACEECREDGAGVLSAALSLEEKAFARRMARWVWEQRFLTLDEEGAPLDPVDLERGCRVVVHGLTSSSGLLLNGKRGTLGGGLGAVRPGRYPIFMKGSSGEGYKHIKPCNIVCEAGPAKIILSGVMECRDEMNGVYERNQGYKTNGLPVYTRLGDYPGQKEWSPGVHQQEDTAHLYSGNDGCWHFSSNTEHMQEGRSGLVTSRTASRSPLNLRWKVDSAFRTRNDQPPGYDPYHGADTSPDWNPDNVEFDNVVTVAADVTSHWREAIGGELWRFIACPPPEPHSVRVLVGHDYTLLALFAALGATRLAAALEFGAFVRIDHCEYDVAVLTLCAAPFGEDGGAVLEAELKMIPIGRLDHGTFELHCDWCAEGLYPMFPMYKYLTPVIDEVGMHAACLIRAAAHHASFKCRMCKVTRKHRMHRPFICDECGCSSDPNMASPPSARHGFGAGLYGSGGGGMCGFTESQVEELACQGLKPWDDDAGAVMSFLHGGGDGRW
jgi:hypothetical protein